MITCIIIEDEPLAAEKLKGFIKKVDFLDLHATFDNGAAAIGYLNGNKIDLIFLDICMDELDGMQLMASLTRLPKIIITSAESQYALPSYEYRVSDYYCNYYRLPNFRACINHISLPWIKLNILNAIEFALVMN
jgi:DNA-binding LytR/AlgR family response regulator